MTLIAGHTPEIKAWVEARIPHVNDFGPCEGIGILGSNSLIAGVIYHDYQPDFGTIQLSMAADSPRWAKKMNIARLLQYPFEQLGCYKVWTLTPIKNEKALKVNKHIGFKQEAVLRHQFGGLGHGVVCSILLKEYRTLYGDYL